MLQRKLAVNRAQQMTKAEIRDKVVLLTDSGDSSEEEHWVFGRESAAVDQMNVVQLVRHRLEERVSHQDIREYLTPLVANGVIQKKAGRSGSHLLYQVEKA